MDLDFLFRSWHITQTVILLYEFTPTERDGRSTYSLRLIDDETSFNADKGEKTILALGAFEPSLPCCFHSDGETIIFVDDVFVELLELYILAYSCDSIKLGGVSVQDHEIVLCALILAMSRMTFRGGSYPDRVKERIILLAPNYSAQLGAIREVFGFRELLSGYLPLNSHAELFPLMLQVIVHHELSHILFHKHRPLFEEEVQFVRAMIERTLKSRSQELRRLPVSEIELARSIKKIYYSKMQGDSSMFTEIFCDFSAAELLITTNASKLRGSESVGKFCYAGLCILDAIVKISSLLNEQAWNSPTENPLILRRKARLAQSEAALRQMALHLGLTSAMAVPGVVNGLTADSAARKLWVAELDSVMRLFLQKRDRLFWTHHELLRSIFSPS